MIAALTYPILASSPGVSDEANHIDEQGKESWQRIQESRAYGSAELFDELDLLVEECSTEGWDGYNAKPVQEQTYQEAVRFLQSLPWGIPRPELGAEPDGHITFEWHSSARRTLSVSVSPDGLLHYSAIVGTSCQMGTEPLLGEMPTEIEEIVRRILPA